MNISGTANPACFTSSVPSQAHHMYNISDHQDIASSSLDQATTSSSSESHVSSILYNFSLLKEKVQHVQSLMSILISPDQNQLPESTSIAVASMGTLVQEIIVNASSMMLTCQQMYNNNSVESSHQQQQHQQQPLRFSEGSFSQLINFGINRTNIDSLGQERVQSFSNGMFDWYGNHVDSCNSNVKDNNRGVHIEHKEKTRELVLQGGENNDGTLQGFLTNNNNNNNNCDIIELDAADLLAKYTHYCQVCGKGFKRDANLRMHMRAHGDEYKSAAALSNPMKKSGSDSGNEDISVRFPRKYSCPHEGCRWNQKHAKFQPLKSIICVKNHYKRSHCPKMYVCKRCNRKQFSILSDLRTHEKHCGNLKWQCSCGTTFSRKDKLMGHVTLFVGHTPLINLTTRQGN